MGGTVFIVKNHQGGGGTVKAAALLRLLDGDWVRGRDGRARKTLATPEQPAEPQLRPDDHRDGWSV